MKYLTTNFLFLFVTFFTVGCETVPQAPAPTAIINGKSLEDVKGVIINTYTSSGWRLDNDSTYQLVFLKQAEPGSMATYLYGSGYDNKVYFREKLTISKVGETITIRPYAEVVTNYGSAYEKGNPISNYASTVVRFNKIKSHFGISVY